MLLLAAPAGRGVPSVEKGEKKKRRRQGRHEFIEEAI
jgi:hypothetical protein